MSTKPLAANHFRALFVAIVVVLGIVLWYPITLLVAILLAVIGLRL